MRTRLLIGAMAVAGLAGCASGPYYDSYGYGPGYSQYDYGYGAPAYGGATVGFGYYYFDSDGNRHWRDGDRSRDGGRHWEGRGSGDPDRGSRDWRGGERGRGDRNNGPGSGGSGGGVGHGETGG